MTVQFTNVFVTMFRMVTASAVLILVMAAGNARADQDINPDLFTNQSIAPTSQFGWDEFTGSFAGPHSPDVFATGGTGTLTSTVGASAGGFPSPTITGTQNLYIGGFFASWDADLTGLPTTESNSTYVLQIAAVGTIDLGSFWLDGVAPTTFVDRGSAVVVHDIDSGPGVEEAMNYYWAEFQASSSSTAKLEFAAGHPHFSLAAVRVDVYNTAAPFSAVAAATVPEPSTFLLALLGLCGFISRRNRVR